MQALTYGAFLPAWAAVLFLAWVPVQAQNLRTQEVRCKSEDFRQRECRLRGPIVRVRLKDQKSSAACREGYSYGFRGEILWVDRGCDAEFDVTFRSSGNSGPGRYPPSPNDPDRGGYNLKRVEIECKSENYRRRDCRVGGRIERAFLRDTDSDAPCIEGRSWGWDRDYVWVNNGCDGDFEVHYVDNGSSGPIFGGGDRRERITCSSRDYRQEQCYVEGRITDIRLLRRRSGAECRLGRSYGYRRDYVWVDEGCSADFEVYYRDGRGGGPPPGGRDGDVLSCKSHDYRYNSCRADRFIRRVRLLEQKSDAPCRRGESWGWQGNIIWVDKGCSAEFEVDYR
ncbi:MAG TPA: DUF3011 domain-containing protein [Acidobacteriota bacterium]|nr:DUF3011 domain-containing protein [Acidobacteriota bacterium]